MKIKNGLTKAMGALAIASTLAMPTAAYAADYSSSISMHIKVEATQMEVAIPTDQSTIEAMDKNVPFGGLPIYMKSGFPIQLHSIDQHDGKTTLNFTWDE